MSPFLRDYSRTTEIKCTWVVRSCNLKYGIVRFWPCSISVICEQCVSMKGLFSLSSNMSTILHQYAWCQDISYNSLIRRKFPVCSFWFMQITSEIVDFTFTLSHSRRRLSSILGTFLNLHLLAVRSLTSVFLYHIEVTSKRIQYHESV